jgi:hypothetical protein
MVAYLVVEHIITDTAKIRGIQDEGRADDRQARRTLPDKGREPQNARGRLLEAERPPI